MPATTSELLVTLSSQLDATEASLLREPHDLSDATLMQLAAAQQTARRLLRPVEEFGARVGLAADAVERYLAVEHAHLPHAAALTRMELIQLLWVALREVEGQAYSVAPAPRVTAAAVVPPRGEIFELYEVGHAPALTRSALEV
jgi:hypothetical protein